MAHKTTYPIGAPALQLWLQLWLQLQRELQLQPLNADATTIREARLDLTRGDEWRQQISLYTAALREVRAKLDGFETTLRIRRAQLGQNRARLNAVNAWATLTRELG